MYKYIYIEREHTESARCVIFVRIDRTLHIAQESTVRPTKLFDITVAFLQI